jgi:hypothetical protein
VQHALRAGAEGRTASGVFRIAVLFQINSQPGRRSYKGRRSRSKRGEGPMTTVGQAFLFASEFICLLFAVIAMIYFADRLRSDVLRSLNELSKNHHFREQQ